MRKEISDTYIPIDSGGMKVRARRPGGGIIEYEIPERELCFGVSVDQGLKVRLKPVTVKVTRIDTRLTDIQLVWAAAANCYSNLSTDELLYRAKSKSKKEAEDFLQEKILRTGHWSVIEHRGPAFIIDGISRVTSHQLVRHRLLSFSQQSQRYVDQARADKEGKEVVFPFVIPPRIRADRELVREYIQEVGRGLRAYFKMRAKGAYPEDARFLLPNAAATRIVVSGNRRVWLELIPKRTCARAQWEIDMVVSGIAHLLWKELPLVFGETGPACCRGRCDQGEKACGVPLGKPLAKYFERKAYPHDKLIFGMR